MYRDVTYLYAACLIPMRYDAFICHVREGAFKSRAAIRKVSWHDWKKKMS